MSASPDTRVREIVAAADATRRRRESDRVLARLAPIAGGAALVVAALGRWFAWPSSVSIAALVVFAAAVAAFTFFQRRSRPSTDAIALRVDRDASLGGELHSAHWFAGSSERDEPWTAFHLERAAVRADAVSWSELYPRVNASKSWLATGVGVVATLALTFAVPGRQASLVASTDGTAKATAPLGMVPPELQKQIEAMLAAMKDGLLTEADVKNALAKLDKDAMQLDPAMQAKLAEMLKARKIDEEAKQAKGAADAEEAQEVDNFGLPEDVKWALEDMAKRLANSPADRKTNAENPSASSKSAEKGMGSDQAESESSTAQMSLQMVREAAADQSQSQMMMGGGGGMGGDPRSGAGGNSQQDAQAQAQALLIAQALKKETVEANTDALGSNVPKEDIRRKTEAGRSGIGYAKVAPMTSFDASRAVAPPEVPESRRPLVQSYFIRR